MGLDIQHNNAITLLWKWQLVLKIILKVWTNKNSFPTKLIVRKKKMSSRQPNKSKTSGNVHNDTYGLTSLVCKIQRLIDGVAIAPKLNKDGVLVVP